MGNLGIWGMVIIFAIVSIIAFLITREFWCWYWKINERIKLMEKQNEYLRLVLKNQNIELPEDKNSIKTSSSNEEQKKCNDCGHMVKMNEKKCKNCGSGDFSQI